MEGRRNDGRLRSVSHSRGFGGASTLTTLVAASRWPSFCRVIAPVNKPSIIGKLTIVVKRARKLYEAALIGTMDP